MARVWSTPAAKPAALGTATRTFLDFLVAQGIAVHLSSGNGAATYSTTTDVYAPGTLRSWGRYSLFGTARQIIFGTLDDGTGNPGRSMRAKYSRLAGFIGGAPSATVPPSATDEQFLCGSGTDAVGAPAAIFPTSVTDYRHAMMCDAVTREVFWIGWTTGGTIVWTILIDPLVSGTYDVLDEDPFVFYFVGNSASDIAKATVSSSGWLKGNVSLTAADAGLRCWWGAGWAGGAAQWRQCQGVGMAMGDNVNALRCTSNGRTYTDNVTGYVQLTLITYALEEGFGLPRGKRGYSSMCRWQSGNRAALTTISVTGATSKDYLVVNDLALPWNGTDPAGWGAPVNSRGDLWGYPTVGVIPDVSKPVVAIVSPTASTTITTATRIVVDITDNKNLFRRIILTAQFPGYRITEVVYDGEAFTEAYRATSTVTVITNGYRFSLLRDPGWPDSPTLRPYAIDTEGNENL